MTPSDDIYAQRGPFGGATEDQMERYLARLSPQEYAAFNQRQMDVMRQVREQRFRRVRPRPSTTMRSVGDSPTLAVRQLIVDLAAERSDIHGEAGRADQCVPFACYVRAMLNEIGQEAHVQIGRATYTMHGKQYVMHHAWVESGADLIDANVDSFAENCVIPGAIKPQPYWGPKKTAPHRTMKVVRELRVERETVEVHDDFERERATVLAAFRDLMAGV